jgi:hypothetical protein
LCTRTCDQQSSCAALVSAECILPADADACTEATPEGVCDVRCQNDDDCAQVSSSHRCEAGLCRVPVADACEDDGISANQVLLIGDSFFASDHQITTYLEDLARSAGSLPAAENYRDNSQLVSNGLAFGGNGILDQYSEASASAAVKVVIMNGGGADVLLGNCAEVSPECPLIADAANAAQALLARLAEDGVLHVIYAFYPDPQEVMTRDNRPVRERMDVLRPLIASICESSPVPCHWLDLRTIFDGRYAEYVKADGLNPTPAGSQATAAAIWQTMERFCIAQ